MNEAKRKYMEIMARGGPAHVVVGPNEQVLDVFEQEAEARAFAQTRNVEVREARRPAPADQPTR